MTGKEQVSVSVKIDKDDLNFLGELAKGTPKKAVGEHIRDAVKEYIDKKRRG